MAVVTQCVIMVLHYTTFPFGCLNVGWLEPLLDRIAADDTVVVAPMIVGISKDTFAFGARQLEQIGGIDIPKVEFKWLPMNAARRKNHQPHEPFKYVHTLYTDFKRINENS